jgi:polar amino acid transport system permease protein
MDYNWNFAPLVTFWPVLLEGLKSTLFLFAVSLAGTLSLGLVVGLCRYSRAWYLYYPATLFVEIFRNIPVLVQIMWFYFAFPIIAPVRIDPLSAALLGIVLNGAAYASELYRAGIQSIEPGQWEGGRAIGMSYFQIMRRVVLPQAIRRVLPPLTSRMIEVFKATTLASVVSYPEILYRAKLLSSRFFNPIETYTVLALAFFLILFPLVRATMSLERRLSRSD